MAMSVGTVRPSLGSGQHAQGFVEADGVLDQSQGEGPAAVGQAFDAAERRAVGEEGAGDRRVGDVASGSDGRRGDGVVGVEQAGDGHSQRQGAASTGRPRNREPQAFESVERDVGPGNVEGGACRAAPRAAPGAEVGAVEPVVGEGGAAAAARLGVGGVGDLGQVISRVMVVQSERDPSAR